MYYNARKVIYLTLKLCKGCIIMKNVIKKTVCAALSAITLSACVIVPTSFNKTSFVNSIEANAAFSPYVGLVITKKDNLNVRSGPGKNYKVLYSVKKGTHVAILEVRGNWGKVTDEKDYPGGQWVCLDYIKDITPYIYPTYWM
jgi:uncharacterized protein YgiM (DUF1202 family)